MSLSEVSYWKARVPESLAAEVMPGATPSPGGCLAGTGALEVLGMLGNAESERRGWSSTPRSALNSEGTGAPPSLLPVLAAPPPLPELSLQMQQPYYCGYMGDSESTWF